MEDSLDDIILRDILRDILNIEELNIDKMSDNTKKPAPSKEFAELDKFTDDFYDRMYKENNNSVQFFCFAIDMEGSNKGILVMYIDNENFHEFTDKLAHSLKKDPNLHELFASAVMKAAIL